MRLASLLAAASLCAAPPPEQILARTRAALGKPDDIKSLSLKGSRRTSVPGSETTFNREFEFDLELPGRFLKSETMELPGGMPGPAMLECLDGEDSWRDTRNVPTGAHIMIRTGPPGQNENDPAVQAARTKSLRAQFLRTLLLYTVTPPAALGVTWEYVGEAEAPDGKAWILDAMHAGAPLLRLFIDQQSNLPIMATYRGPHVEMRVRTLRLEGPPPAKGQLPPGMEPPKPRDVEFEIRLADYAPFSGLNLPKTITTSVEGNLIEQSELKSARINPSFKPGKFKK